MRVVQVVPQAPPEENGLAAFAGVLAGALERVGIQTALLQASAGSFEEDLVSRVAKAPVLVHYVGYAYDRRGCPDWFVDGLARWSNREAPTRRITVFHEVYASGPPWSSSFWLGPRQKRLAERLARLSDAVVTSVEAYRDRLAPWRPPGGIVVMPVASTVGEPRAVPAIGDRAPHLVVFGAAGNRARVFRRHGAALEAACRALGIEEILDIGPPLSGDPPRVTGIPVRALGRVTADEASRLLRGARAGASAYAPAFLAKSTVFAAYCAHGLLPVCLRTGSGEADGLRAGRDYWAPAATIPGPEEVEDIARSARAWYLGHSLAIQARRYADLLGARP